MKIAESEIAEMVARSDACQRKLNFHLEQSTTPVSDRFSLTIEVPGEPVPQPRQRHRMMKVKGKMIIVNYTPKDDPSVAQKERVRQAARSAYRGSSIKGMAFSVTIDFIFPRLKNLVWKTREMPRIRKITRPDRDNMEKLVLDALNGIIWYDDGQVCDGPVRKWIASGNESPRTIVKIEEIRGDESQPKLF